MKVVFREAEFKKISEKNEEEVERSYRSKFQIFVRQSMGFFTSLEK